MPIIDIQLRARELGRIRLGQKVATNNGGTRPAKLDRFRFTSASQHLVETIASLYGGDAHEWDNNGSAQWEVITDAKRVPVMVPPQPLSQWYELWSGGGCQRRCDGQTEILTESPCLCAAADNRMCKPTTRLNVVLADVPGIGVWRVETHGWYAALELPQAAEFLMQTSGYVNAHLALEERSGKGENERTGKIETRRWMVPTLEIEVTPRELMAGQGSVQPGRALSGANGQPERRAIGQAPPAEPDSTTTPPADARADERPDYVAEARAYAMTDGATYDGVKAVWYRADQAGDMTPELHEKLGAIANWVRDRAAAQDTGPGTQGATEDVPEGIGDPQTTSGPSLGEVGGPDVPTPRESEGEERRRLWREIVAAAGELDPPKKLSEVKDEFAKFADGETQATADVSLLREFLDGYRAQAAA